MADPRAEGDSYGSDTIAEPVKSAPASAVPGSAPPLSSFASQFGAQTDKVERSINQTNQARNDLVGWMKANPRPEPPKLAAPVAPPENKPQPSPLESFGSVASALGVMGGFLTRKPLVTALNASTAAMKALHDKNNEEFDRNYKVWEEQSKFAEQTMKWQTNQYEQLMKAHEGRAADMLTALTVQAAATKDEVLLKSLRMGDLETTEKILNDRSRLGLQFEKFRLDVEAQKQDRDHKIRMEELKLQEISGKKGTPEEEATKQFIRDQTAAGKPVTAEDLKKFHQDWSGQTTRAANQQAKVDAKEQEKVDSYDIAIGQIDQLLARIEEAQKNGGLGITGLGGRLKRNLETVTSMTGLSDKTPASDFESQLNTLRAEAPKLITGNSKSAKDERLRIDTILRGTNYGDTHSKTTNSLKLVRDILTARRASIAGGDEAEPVTGIDLNNLPSTLDIGRVYQPNGGKRQRYKGGPVESDSSWETLD